MRGLFGRRSTADDQHEEAVDLDDDSIEETDYAEPTPREQQKALREARAEENRALVYRGNRKYVRYLGVALTVAPVLALASFCSANSKVSEKDLQTAVAAEFQKQGGNFPVGSAVQWAGMATRTWGTWDQNSADARAVLLAPFLSSGMDRQAGWNGKGKQDVLTTSVNPNPKVIDENYALINAAYQIGDGTWRCVTIKTFAFKPATFSSNAEHAFAMSGNPTPIACSPETGAPALPSTEQVGRNDQSTAEELRASFFPGFFAAWAASDQSTLAQYMADGVKTVGLGGAFASSPGPRITDVALPVPPGMKDGELPESVTATVGVTWTITGSDAALSAVYTVPMTRHGKQWFVSGEPAPSKQDNSVSGGRGSSSTNPNTDATSGAGLYNTATPTTSQAPSMLSPGGVTSGG